MINKQMKFGIRLFGFAAVAIGLANCAQPERPVSAARLARTGRFSGEGKVSLYAGQPCASQIMFDFHGTGVLGNVQLAAPMPETRLLTEAAMRHRRVHIWGSWRTGPEPDCQYIKVARVETAQ